MATARDYIGRAMRLLGVIAAGEDAEASEAANGLQSLNAMLNAWALDGLDIGTAAYVLNDEVYIPKGYEKGVAHSLAVEMAPEYGMVAPQMVLMQAARMEALIRALQFDSDELTIDPMLTRGGR